MRELRLRRSERSIAVAGGLLPALLVVALALAPAAAGHALLQSSEPAAGTTVGTAPATIRLTFGERPDPRLSSVKVLDSSNRDHATGPAAANAANPLELEVGVDALPDGVYTVSWRTTSAVDGHSSLGSFAFGVGVAPPQTGTTETAPPLGLAAASPIAALARLLLYAGLIAMFGGGVVGVFIVPGRARASARLGLGGSVLAAAGAASVVAVQWSGAQSDIGAILGTSLGVTGIARLVLAALGVVAGIAAWRATAGEGTVPGRPRPLALATLTGASGLAMAVDVVGGHAAAAQPAVLQLAFQWFHVAAAGFWIGGLAALLASVRGAPQELRGVAARRFSVVAGVAIAIVAVTGALRAIAEVGTLDALLSTDYGRIVIAKGLLIAVLALIGATNHFWSVPVAGPRFSRLRRLGTTEVTIAMVAIALTAALVDLAPPVSSGPPPAAAAAAPLIAAGNDFGTSVRVRLVVTPGSPGTNTFAAAVTDYDSGAPVDASDVSLRFDLASATGVGTSTLDLTRAQAGSYAASGANLSVDGIWKVTATVTSSGGAVEVPLVLSTVVAAEPVDVNASPGVPTIYVVHLADGRTVQLYLDPETAGKDEVHSTFFDATGTELPVAAATMAIAPAAGPAQILTTRQLEPGHYVADVDLPAGPLVVDVVGPDPATGAPIHVHLSITVQP